MSGVIEISDDSNDSIGKNPAVFSILGTDDEDSEIKQESSSQTIKDTFSLTEDSDEDISINNFKQKLISDLFHTNKRKKPVVQHEKPSFLHQLMIRGVNVKLPVKPYGCQVALMSTIITSIQKSENCILESPTGTGKTLALLCASLAWQQLEQTRIRQDLDADLLCGDNGNVSTPVKKFENLHTSSTPVKSEFFHAPSTPEVLWWKPVYGERSIYDSVENSSECGEFGVKRKWGERQSPSGCGDPGLVTIHKKANVDNTTYVDLTQGYPQLRIPDLTSTPEKTKREEGSQNSPKKNRYRVLPIIFYGTRTHKQLEQVIKEFARTHYCGAARMTVLSSRDHSCIREFDRSQWPTKNDMCRDCIKKRVPPTGPLGSTNCKYYDNRGALDRDALPPAFNLEQLVAAGREVDGCPYYAAKFLTNTSEIVFCPYNYLIDAGIRKSMNISLRDNILIIDEAHNIEGVCRDAATFTVHQDQIRGALKEFETASMYRYANQGADGAVDVLKNALDKWDYWFTNQKPLLENQQANNGEVQFTWKEVKFFADTLDNHDIGRPHFPEFSHNVQVFCRRFTDDPRAFIGITQSTCTLVETIEIMLGYLYRNNGRNMDDFVPVLGITEESKFKKASQLPYLTLMCMNPAVVFQALCAARAVVLASGTLAPLAALAAELAAPFPHHVRPPHVVPPDQVWIGVVCTGPDRTRLSFTFAQSKELRVQDALGRTLLYACQLTPHGVLCFLPSYRLINTLQARWRETGLWNSLADTKHVFIESQKVTEHNNIMEEYYSCAGAGRGALLLAVYRGKVAEGMDFRDRQARLVVAVGIPFPSRNEPAVTEKMKYNNRHLDRGLLGGDEWYTAQAFRALNQALGRCVRHRADWGGALLVDERYAQRSHAARLPAWLHRLLERKDPYTFDGLDKRDDVTSLSSFMHNMTLRESEES